MIPEGGSNEPAVHGCVELAEELQAQLDFDVVCCAVGTGGTLAGAAGGLRPGRRAIGFSALKGGEFLSAGTEQLQRAAFGARTGDWTIETGFPPRRVRLAHTPSRRIH